MDKSKLVAVFYGRDYSHCGGCWESTDEEYSILITETPERLLKEELQAYAKEKGAKLDYCEFIESLKDIGLFIEGNGSSYVPGWVEKQCKVVIDLGEINREDLWGEELYSEIVAEKTRELKEKALEEKQRQERLETERELRQLEKLEKKYRQ